ARWSRSLVREHRDSIPEGAGPGSRPAVASPHRRDACSAPPLPETVVTVSDGPQSLHAQAADRGGWQEEEADGRREFRDARTQPSSELKWHQWRRALPNG